MEPGAPLDHGLSCRDVLAKLDALADGTMEEGTREAVLAHVAGCERCARFGVVYAAVVRRVQEAGREEELEDGVLMRLKARLAASMGPLP